MVEHKDLNIKESDTTPLAMQKAMIRVGKPSLEELDWVIWEIWPEMIEPRSISIFITRLCINLALSILRSEV